MCTNKATFQAVEHFILTQVEMKKQIKMWGEEGIAATIKEMTQFHDRNVDKPLQPSEIIDDIKEKALGSNAH